MRPDGTVFAAGGTGFNDVYNVGAGTWASGPSFPTISDFDACVSPGTIEQLAMADAPAALLPDGNVLLAASPIDANCGWITPTEYFEFDGTNLTRVNAPATASELPSFVERLLVLPTGQILRTDDSSTDIEIYTPSGSPNAAWAPTIATFPSTISPGGTNNPISGTQFNGLSQAVSYGDDYQGATNYPLVRITNNGTGHVFYARTHNHSTMAVATGNATVSTEFDVPGGIELGASTLVVVANGIESASVDVTVAISGATPTPTVTPTQTPTSTPTPNPDVLKITPTSVNFHGVKVGHSSPKVTVTLLNTATSGPPITFFSITVPQTNPQIFGFFSSTCGPQLLPKKTCKLKMGFQPIAKGLQTDAVTILDDTVHGTQMIPLKGKGK